MSTVFILSLTPYSTAMSMLYRTKLDFKQQIPGNTVRIYTENFDKETCFLATKGRKKSAERRDGVSAMRNIRGAELKYHTKERIKASVCIIKFVPKVLIQKY